MESWPPRRLSAVPRDWTVRAEIMRAVRTLAMQHEEDQQQRRQAELAAIRRDCELLPEAICEVWHGLSKAGFNRDEPRVPAGNPDGGEWTRGAGGAPAGDSHVVISDATPENNWVPGGQYAANSPPGIGHNQGPPLDEPPKIPPKTPAKLR